MLDLDSGLVKGLASLNSAMASAVGAPLADFTTFFEAWLLVENVRAGRIICWGFNVPIGARPPPSMTGTPEVSIRRFRQAWWIAEAATASDITHWW